MAFAPWLPALWKGSSQSLTGNPHELLHKSRGVLAYIAEHETVSIASASQNSPSPPPNPCPAMLHNLESLRATSKKGSCSLRSKVMHPCRVSDAVIMHQVEGLSI